MCKGIGTGGISKANLYLNFVRRLMTKQAAMTGKYTRKVTSPLKNTSMWVQEKTWAQLASYLVDGLNLI